MNLSDALNIADLRTMARRRMPRMAFDYIDGGADDEVTLREATRRFDDYELTWNALVDIAEVDTSTTLMGQPTRLPFFISPVAGNRPLPPRRGPPQRSESRLPLPPAGWGRCQRLPPLFDRRLQTPPAQWFTLNAAE